MLGCAGKGYAAVVDPQDNDLDSYIEFATTKGMRITHVIDTHVHADHISGGRALSERTGAAYACLGRWLMFRNVPLVVANMSVAMVSVIWSMRLLIGLRYPVHIISSMGPAFLMAIATESVQRAGQFINVRLR